MEINLNNINVHDILCQKGSDQSNRKRAASVTPEQVRKIAEDKMPDLNCFKIESAMNMVAGTARSMGVTIAGNKPF